MKKITLLILIKLFLFTSFVNSKSLETPIINLNPEIIEEKYTLTDKYEEPLALPDENVKKEDSSLNLDANVNKEKREIDSLKIDIGKKF
ncbi:hypothetical protein [Poseidonibacter ostreae]|jgi:hypothetical protein|uniref:Uncharacterized protein n=1 Tax=Poseidonibacter ostreae TaxID=2654171 RepID=A0A6L4WVZ9_9BACT|nr:hypothetical protein [Poseidonibacter ostreae]KAB7887638.1 hypothetical protein GA417_01475 [Poseidonibacter ostreae]KAB7890659.1 hypothetical protein GBG19_02665 [Poseidonibacter ostreae]KAB7892358.1 hypothetical protein GBG18_02715 [Poseidonibacter ostreae]MAC83284.1 hypothetical protein [Arcobacter sp.]|tara:strand:+ start:98 stop:364 length:267 start_codon:yes stop_codon:yes gene_type:complete